MRQALDGVHILLVEDDDDTRDVFKVTLQYQGGLVIEVADAAAALGLLGTMRFDVMVSDIALPGHDGVWLMTEAKRRGIAVPALAITALTSAPDVDRILDAGFRTYLAKPADPNDLCMRVQALARGRTMPAESDGTAGHGDA